MKKLLITTAMLTAFAFTTAHAETEAQAFSAFAARQQEYRQEVKQEINEACARKWGTNYEMQLYCRTKQEDAFEVYLRMMAKAVNWLQTTTDSSARVWAGIISDCVNKWGSDINFDMINYCVSKQLVPRQRDWQWDKQLFVRTTWRLYQCWASRRFSDV